MAKVITFGEIMLRLSTTGYLRFSQAKQFEATFGGGEANVAVSLANYGIETEFTFFQYLRGNTYDLRLLQSQHKAPANHTASH